MIVLSTLDKNKDEDEDGEWGGDDKGEDADEDDGEMDNGASHAEKDRGPSSPRKPIGNEFCEEEGPREPRFPSVGCTQTHKQVSINCRAAFCCCCLVGGMCWL